MLSIIIYCGSKDCFSWSLSGFKTIREVLKGPLKYPGIYEWGNSGLSSVMVSANLALALQHSCGGRQLPNLHLNMPAAGPGTGLAHTGDARAPWTEPGCWPHALLGSLWDVNEALEEAPCLSSFTLNGRELTPIEPACVPDSFMDVISFILTTV